MDKERGSSVHFRYEPKEPRAEDDSVAGVEVIRETAMIAAEEIVIGDGRELGG